MKFLEKHVWPWKTIAKLKEELRREVVCHANTKSLHQSALQKIKWHEQSAERADGYMRKMAQIITKTSGFGS